MFNNSKSIEESLKYRYILAFGSNLGNRKLNCQKGLSLILKQVKLVKISKYIATAPLLSEKYSQKDHEDYCNMVCEILSNHKPLALYKIIEAIEDIIGHNRTGKWLPRELDIDILFWAENTHTNFDSCPALSYRKENFSVPHKEFTKRDFLKELCLHDLALGHECLQRHLENSTF